MILILPWHFGHVRGSTSKGIGGNKLKGKLTITGGTGNFTGIIGEGEFDRLNVAKPAMKGTSQGYTKSKFTWKIEKTE